MISIVISSYKDNLYNNLCKNISNTIGETPYEIIRIYNPKKMSISEAYNEGVISSNFNYILLLHEDVEFLSKNWGEEVLKQLLKPEIGLLGLAGTTSKSKIVSNWNTGHIQSHYYNLIQQSGDKKEVILKNFYCPVEVVAIDGFFMACRKKVYLQNKLDENLVLGYHGYDLYLSLRIGSNYKIVLLDNIVVKHFSLGTPNKEWWDTNIKINDFFKDSLPRYSSNFSSMDRKKVEFQALKSLVKFNLFKIRNVAYVRSVLVDVETRKLVGFWNYAKIYIYYLMNTL